MVMGSQTHLYACKGEGILASGILLVRTLR